jgi:hypothetical protein
MFLSDLPDDIMPFIFTMMLFMCVVELPPVKDHKSMRVFVPHTLLRRTCKKIPTLMSTVFVLKHGGMGPAPMPPLNYAPGLGGMGLAPSPGLGARLTIKLFLGY